MRRAILTLCMVAIGAAAARAQDPRGIPWSLRVEDSVAQAKQSRLPLMFYVVEHRYCDAGEVILGQEKAFRDPRVRELAKRFVPVKLSRTRYGDLLESWRVDPDGGLEIVFVTPDGDRIDVLAPQGAAIPDILARKMWLVFNHYRTTLFEKDVLPTLEDAKASEEKLTAAFELIENFVIEGADQNLVDMFDRDDLSQETANRAYKTLAALSTETALDFLLREAVEVEAAAEALKGCTPDAAERMLEHLESENEFLKLAVYHAVTTICKIDRVKPDRFWSGKQRYVINNELKRVRKKVKDTARRWRELYAEYR